MACGKIYIEKGITLGLIQRAAKEPWEAGTSLLAISCSLFFKSVLRGRSVSLDLAVDLEAMSARPSAVKRSGSCYPAWPVSAAQTTDRGVSHSLTLQPELPEAWRAIPGAWQSG